MKVAVIKYNAGNIRSVSFALQRLHIDHTITDEPEAIRSADKVIFPGVGEASTTMSYLRDKKLDQLITQLRQPVLGICLGMQLLCAHSEENDTPCLGIFPESVKKFSPLNHEKVPHMGWNSLTVKKNWLDASFQGQYVYFVHSYYVPLSPFTEATSYYTQEFSSVMKKDNFYAVQFHPEKSAQAGEKIIVEFLKS